MMAHQVGVAAALPVAVDGALHAVGALGHGHQRVGHGAAPVVVGVDGHPAPVAQLGDHPRDDLLDQHGQHGAVGVAEHDGFGPRSGGRAQALESVVRMSPVGVEEVFRVVVDDLALLAQEAHRLGDHPQVLGPVHAQDLLHVQVPGLAHDAGDRRPAVDQGAQVLVLGRRGALGPGHAERGYQRRPQVLAPAACGRTPRPLGLDAGETALDDVHAQIRDADRDAHLLIDGDAHPLALHAVAKGGVVQQEGAGHRHSWASVAALRGL